MCFVIYITPKITNSSLGYTLSVSTKKSVTASETRIPVIWALGRHLYGWGRVYYWLVKLNLLGLTAIWHMMIQCTTNTECDSGLTFFISHFRQCYSDKSVMPGGTFFFFSTCCPHRERLAHNSILEAGRDLAHGYNQQCVYTQANTETWTRRCRL